MKYTLKAMAAVFAITSVYAYAGGDPEHVKFPEGYSKTFTQYGTMNRANQTQVAKLYANEAAISGYKQGNKSAPGGVLVMENRNNWDASFPKENRTGDWGFAVYNPEGTAKSNDLNCVQCHTPLQAQDYLFTYQKLVDFVKK